MLLIERAWSGIHAARAHLVHNMDLQIVNNVNLAREPDVIREFGFHRQAVAFQFTHFAGISSKHLNAAGGTTCVAAAAMENVYSRILKDKDQLLSGGGFNSLQASGGLSFNSGH
jgi:hypothetical protein